MIVSATRLHGWAASRLGPYMRGGQVDNVSTRARMTIDRRRICMVANSQRSIMVSRRKTGEIEPGDAFDANSFETRRIQQ
jgi:hypothetical protein